MEYNKLFWLHIKKAGGTSMRDLFTDFYVLQDNRYTKPAPFIAIPKESWNDALNNFRIPLGEYDYKRMLFAKKFLYTESDFNSMFKFTVVRNPYDRAVSGWKYLTRNNFLDFRFQRMKYSFEYFLEVLPEYMEIRRKQIYDLGYIGLHLAPVWNDITDEDGRVLVNKIIKLENFNEEMAEINNLFNLNIKLETRKNIGKRDSNYRKYYNRKTKTLVENIFGQDIENLEYNF